MPDLDAPKTHPVGTITMWSGTLATIPNNWILCDGTNGTPNLTARFIRGAPDTINPGTTGGSDTHVLTEAELAPHSHGLTDSQHFHTKSIASSQVLPRQTSRATANGSTLLTPSSETSGITVNDTGSGSGHESRPAFYEMAYIYKVK